MENLGEILKGQSELRDRFEQIAAEWKALSPEERKRRERQRWLDINAEGCERQLKLDGYAPKPYCPKCGGTGWYTYDVDIRHPSFGQAIMCDEAGCYKDSWEAYKRGDQYLSQKGITKQTFDNFKRLKGTEDAYKLAKELAEGTAQFICLLVYGRPGNGKTHLLNAAARKFSECGVDARIYSIPTLLSNLKKAMGENKLEEEVDRLKEHSALLLDDWGSEHETEWAESKVFEILEHRFAQYRITMVTTNKDVAEIKNSGDMGARLISRFNDAEVARICLNQGQDYRLQK